MVGGGGASTTGFAFPKIRRMVRLVECALGLGRLMLGVLLQFIEVSHEYRGYQ